jgi:hypothetical protein
MQKEKKTNTDKREIARERKVDKTYKGIELEKNVIIHVNENWEERMYEVDRK